MSGEESILQSEDGQMLAAEFKDGRLQIVEVAPFEKSMDTHILPDSISDNNEPKYIQVLDASGKGLMQLDLLNFTLVKCEESDESYQMVGGSSDDGETLTCVLANDDEEVTEDASSYVLLESVQEQNQPTLTEENSKKPQLTPTEILEKAKALQKTKALLNAQITTKGTKGRKRKSSLPNPIELLSSPNFKLYLYSCKMCTFKCNAVKEMSAHKAIEHGGNVRTGNGPAGTKCRAAHLQCAQCPFRAAVHSQLLKHVREVHNTTEDGQDTKPNDSVDVELLVCGACGFESPDRSIFRDHIQNEHGVNVALNSDILTIEEQ